MKKFTPWLVGFLFCLLLFLKTDPGASSVEKRIYSHYATSVVEDLDFNVVNQIPIKEAWLLTPTLNYPDMHSNGVSVLWAPFFYVAKAASSAVIERPKLYRLAQSLAGVFWALLSLPVLWLILRSFYSEKISWATLGITLICTPFFWFTLFQPENADTSALFLSSCLVYMYIRRNEQSAMQFSFFWGMALFFSFAVKIDTIFIGILFLHFLLEKARVGFRPLLSSLFTFAVGALPVFFCVLINESLKYGYTNYGYLDTVTSEIYVLIENMFGPTGYFKTHPYYLLIILGFLALAWKKQVKSEFWFFLAIPLTELALESFNYNYNEAYGPRHWLNDTPFFALLTGFVLNALPVKKLHRDFFVFCLFSAFVSLYAATVYKLRFDLYYSGNWIQGLRDISLSQYSFWTELPWLSLKINFLYELLLLAGLCTLFCFLLLKYKKLPIFLYFFVFASLAYATLSGLNYQNNALSATQIPSVTAQAVIGKGLHIQSFFENAGCLQRAEFYYNLMGDKTRAADRRRILEDYVKKAALEIISDPVGFRNTLVPGRATYVPAELWNDE
ncbi:MAG: hypothetical protein AABY53_00940 [Bdellovibrionota bacterium]